MFDLKKACPHCKADSIKKYKRDIKRLYKLNHSGDLPETGTWVNSKKTIDSYSALPLNIRRALSVAGVKAAQAYSISKEKWSSLMFQDVVDYKKKRSKQRLSDKEKEKIPAGGFKALKKISTEFKRSIKHLLETNTLKALYAYTQYIIIRFYSEVAFRNDLATVEIETGKNKLSKKKGIFTIFMTQFKASEKIGNVDVKLSRALSNALTKYLKFRAKFELTHKYLLVNSSGGKMSKKQLGLVLNQLTKKYLGKGFGTRIIRILKARDESKILERAKKVANDMLHSLAQSQSYNKS
jgi:hypothetical protein